MGDFPFRSEDLGEGAPPPPPSDPLEGVDGGVHDVGAVALDGPPLILGEVVVRLRKHCEGIMRVISGRISQDLLAEAGRPPACSGTTTLTRPTL